MRSQFHKKGFSLIELLVVMAIIGMLTGVLFSGVHNARLKAGAAKCISNLRQIGLATQMFMDDHEGKFPSKT